jgi:hypothetical protein
LYTGNAFSGRAAGIFLMDWEGVLMIDEIMQPGRLLAFFIFP